MAPSGWTECTTKAGGVRGEPDAGRLEGGDNKGGPGAKSAAPHPVDGGCGGRAGAVAGSQYYSAVPPGGRRRRAGSAQLEGCVSYQ